MVEYTCQKCGVVFEGRADRPQKYCSRDCYRIEISHDPKSPTKQCSKCKIVYPATSEFFHLHGQNKGFRTPCKLCRSSPKPCALPDDLKRCSTCHLVFPADTEHFPPSNRGKLSSWCRGCSRIYLAELQRDRRAIPEQREKDRAYGREYRSRPEIKARDKVTRAPYRKEYEQRPEHKLKERERSKRRSAAPKTPAHKLSWRMRASRRRAKKRALENSFTTEQWNRALDYFGHCCAVCGKPAGFWLILAIDHWYPLSKGGGTVATNIVPLCNGIKGIPTGDPSCNQSKKDKQPVDWLIAQYGKKKGREIAERIADYFEWVKQQDSE